MKPISNQHIDRPDAGQLPIDIQVYLSRHFDNVPLSDIKKVRRSGQTLYEIVIDTPGNIYRIKFNSEGYLVEKVMEPVFDSVLDETGAGD